MVRLTKKSVDAIEEMWAALPELEAVLDDDTFAMLRVALEFAREEVVGAPRRKGPRRRVFTMEARWAYQTYTYVHPPTDERHFDEDKEARSMWAKEYVTHMEREGFTPHQAWAAFSSR